MIYLIEDRDYLKIGYAGNIKNRMTNYKVENLYVQLRDVKLGTILDEKILHEQCKKYHYQGEWFKNVPEVIEIWNNYTPSIKEDLNIIKNYIERWNAFLLEKEEELLNNYPDNEIKYSLPQNLSTSFKNIEKSIDPLYENGKYYQIILEYNKINKILDAFCGETMDYEFTLSNNHKYKIITNFFNGKCTVNFKRSIVYNDPILKE